MNTCLCGQQTLFELQQQFSRTFKDALAACIALAVLLLSGEWWGLVKGWYASLCCPDYCWQQHMNLTQSGQQTGFMTVFILKFFCAAVCSTSGYAAMLHLHAAVTAWLAVLQPPGCCCTVLQAASLRAATTKMHASFVKLKHSRQHTSVTIACEIGCEQLPSQLRTQPIQLQLASIMHQGVLELVVA
jgi:hypothetical protein